MCIYKGVEGDDNYDNYDNYDNEDEGAKNNDYGVIV